MHDNALRILRALAQADSDQGCHLGELTIQLGLTREQADEHMHELEEAGLVEWPLLSRFAYLADSSLKYRPPANRQFYLITEQGRALVAQSRE